MVQKLIIEIVCYEPKYEPHRIDLQTSLALNYCTCSILAKEKHALKKKTGGGPAVALSPSEELILEYLKDKPQLEGLAAGIESGAPSNEGRFSHITVKRDE